MNVHFSYRADRTPDLENEINQQIQKLTKRMRVFRPELVHLHGDIAPGSSKRNGGTSVSLNLRMPSGQIAATSIAEQPVSAVKDAFHDLIKQFNAHKDHLRNRRNWNRRTAPQVHGAAFEATVAAIKPEEAERGQARAAEEMKQQESPTATDGDVRLYLNTNMRNLERFVRRQLRLRTTAGDVPARLVSPEEVLDETVATALDENSQHPDLMSIEQWLYRIAIQAVDVVAERNRGEDGYHLEAPGGEQNVTGSDESYLQFHQPDDVMLVEDFIPDRSFSNPEQIAYSRESIGQVASALACLLPSDRDAFVLYALEGFTPAEIARISERSEEEVMKSVRSAQQALEARLSPDNAYRSLLRNVS